MDSELTEIVTALIFAVVHPVKLNGAGTAKFEVALRVFVKNGNYITRRGRDVTECYLTQCDRVVFRCHLPVFAGRVSGQQIVIVFIVFGYLFHHGINARAADSVIRYFFTGEHRGQDAVDTAYYLADVVPVRWVGFRVRRHCRHHIGEVKQTLDILAQVAARSSA